MKKSPVPVARGDSTVVLLIRITTVTGSNTTAALHLSTGASTTTVHADYHPEQLGDAGIVPRNRGVASVGLAAFILDLLLNLRQLARQGLQLFLRPLHLCFCLRREIVEIGFP